MGIFCGDFNNQCISMLTILKWKYFNIEIVLLEFAFEKKNIIEYSQNLTLQNILCLTLSLTNLTWHEFKAAKHQTQIWSHEMHSGKLFSYCVWIDLPWFHIVCGWVCCGWAQVLAYQWVVSSSLVAGLLQGAEAASQGTLTFDVLETQHLKLTQFNLGLFSEKYLLLL